MAFFDAYQKLYNIEGKVALVAGGTGGIGSAICEGLAAFGATVVPFGRDGARAEALAARIETAGGRAWGAALDMLDFEAVGRFAEQVVERFGALDVLINAAGTHVDSPAKDYAEADWDRVLDLNLKAAFFLSQAVARMQIPRRGGKHIHISSVRSLLGIHRGYVAYCSSRGGMNMMIKQLATEWARYGITVNGIAPTFTRTELVKDYLDDPDFYNPLVARIPLGRICEPIDLAAMAIYLSAPASDFITGQIIFADGGVTATQ
jgi:NAD(P)-dependent dehydrogenase (short-subunit alcohol dehydrogenase family)